MRAVIQRVKEASVFIDDKEYSAIQKGFLVLLGVESDDDIKDAQYMIDKISNIRIFKDDQDKMNQSLLDVGGSVLLVSQFTLSGDARKGRRPNFMGAEKPERATLLYETVKDGLEKCGIEVKIGQFGAMMDIHLINHGPVTILLDSHRNF